jgi:hypothetical protein
MELWAAPSFARSVTSFFQPQTLSVVRSEKLRVELTPQRHPSTQVCLRSPSSPSASISTRLITNISLAELLDPCATKSSRLEVRPR